MGLFSNVNFPEKFTSNEAQTKPRTRFVKFKNIVAILKNNSATEFPMVTGTNNSVWSAKISSPPQKPLFEVQFLITAK